MGAQQQRQVQQLRFSLYTDFTKMVAFHMLWKLGVVVALGLFATATSTDVAQEQPKKESFLRRFIGKREEPTTEPHEISEPTITHTKKHTETADPPKYSVEWYLISKPENRKELRKQLPYDLAYFVPRNCNSPIAPEVEKEIREYLSLYTVEWYLLAKQENRIALRYLLPSNLSKKVPENSNEPISPEVEQRIRKFFSSLQKKKR